MSKVVKKLSQSFSGYQNQIQVYLSNKGETPFEFRLNAETSTPTLLDTGWQVVQPGEKWTYDSGKSLAPGMYAASFRWHRGDHCIRLNEAGNSINVNGREMNFEVFGKANEQEMGGKVFFPVI